MDDTSVRVFTSDDIYFLMGLGNTIGRAIELNRAMSSLGKNLEEKQLLLREMNHRIKNNVACDRSDAVFTSEEFSRRHGKTGVP